MSQTEPKDPATAGIISLFIPGAGHIYAGEVGMGVVLFLVTAVAYAMFVVPGLIVHGFVIANAVNKVNRSKESSMPGSLPSGTARPGNMLGPALERLASFTVAVPPAEAVPVSRDGDRRPERQERLGVQGNMFANADGPRPGPPPVPPRRPPEDRSASPTAPKGPLDGADVLARFEKIGQLCKDDVLTDEEAGRRRAKVLSELARHRLESSPEDLLAGLVDLRAKGLLPDDDLMRVKALIL